MLTAITKRSEVRAAQKRFYKPFQRAKPTWRTLGMQGHTTQPYEFYWHPNPGLWAVLEDGDDEGMNRSWNCFGTTNPTEGSGTIAISCEINIPHEGMNRQIAGVFARDAAGTEYIAHTGKIGGGRPGISKTNFVHFLGDEVAWSDIYWPDVPKPMRCIVISALDDPDLIKNVHSFVRAVKAFKDPEAANIENAATTDGFTPEFSGERSPYTLTTEIRARCDHGGIVNALKDRLSDELAGSSISVSNNIYTDLLLTEGRRQLAHFEVKTTTSPADIYSAIGQLMYHTAELRTTPARIAVLPEDLPAEALARLKRLGLHVCTYRWERRKPVFPDLPRLLRRLLPSGPRPTETP